MGQTSVEIEEGKAYILRTANALILADSLGCEERPFFANKSRLKRSIGKILADSSDVSSQIEC